MEKKYVSHFEETLEANCVHTGGQIRALTTTSDRADSLQKYIAWAIEYAQIVALKKAYSSFNT